MDNQIQEKIASPTSVISTCYSSETFSDDQIPTSLLAEELQLALNKVRQNINSTVIPNWKFCRKLQKQN